MQFDQFKNAHNKKVKKQQNQYYTQTVDSEKSETIKKTNRKDKKYQPFADGLSAIAFGIVMHFPYSMSYSVID